MNNIGEFLTNKSGEYMNEEGFKNIFSCTEKF